MLNIKNLFNKEKKITYGDVLGNKFQFDHSSNDLIEALGLNDKDGTDIRHRMAVLMSDNPHKKSEAIEAIMNWNVPTGCKIWAIYDLGRRMG